MTVNDDTCTGNRRVEMTKNAADLDSFLDSYSTAILGQTPCMRMYDTTGREKLSAGTVGIIYHTMKFCDYYSFEYMNLKNNVSVPLLKIETDCTSQSESSFPQGLMPSPRP